MSTGNLVEERNAVMLRQTILSLLVLWAGTLSAPAAPVSTPALSALRADVSAITVFSEWSDQRRKPRRVAPAPAPRIACTEFGCHPVPPGCFPVTGYDWRGYPTGFDRIVCRRR